LSTPKSHRKKTSSSAIAQMAKLIKHIRLSLDETQPVFAQRLGTTQSSVSRWELGLAAPGGEFTPDIIALASSTQSLGVGVGAIEMGVPVVGAAVLGKQLLNGEWPVADRRFCYVSDNKFNQEDCRAFLVEDNHAKDLGYPAGTLVVGVAVSKIGRKLRSGDHVISQKPIKNHPTLLETRIILLTEKHINSSNNVYAVFSAMIARPLN
jgi:transcriptional regulator with XRE-family HTH domain